MFSPHVAFILSLAVFFYLILPGSGAFFVRSRWRKFRSALVHSTSFPIAGYSDLRGSGTAQKSENNFRFFGVLEAIQTDDLIWMKNGEIVLAADMTGRMVYILPSLSTLETENLEELNEIALPDEMPTMVTWDKVSSISEGTKVYIAGSLDRQDGRRVFRSTPDTDLLVVFYDGDEDTILRRAIWNGRQRNEYWNPVTPGALGIGALLAIIMAYFYLQNPHFRIPAIFAVGTSLAPLIPIFPPGILFFIIYHQFWGRARFLRAERDLVRLPLRYFEDTAVLDTVELPSGDLYSFRSFSALDEEVLAGRGKFRTTSLARKRTQFTGKFYWFGRIVPDDTYPVKSSDPMVENLVIPGHPEDLARECEKKARLLEILSAAAFGMAFCMNFVLTIRILAWIIR